MENKIVGKDMICPITNQHCDDECCMPGSKCNLSGNSITPGFRMYYFTASKWYGPLEMIDPDFIKHKTPKHEKVYLDKWNNRIQELLSKGPSGDSLIPEFAGMVKEENKDFKFRHEFWAGLYWLETTYLIDSKVKPGTKVRKIAVPLEEEQTAVPVAEEKLSWQEEVIAREEEGKKGNRELAVDFAWENSYRLNSLDGYQSFVKIFNDWYSKNDYHKNKAEEGKPLPKLDKPLISQDDLEAWEKEEGKQTFSEEDMIGFLDWAKKWFTPIEGTEIWMASAKTYVKGNPPDLSEYITADLFLQYTEYLKTKQ